MCISEFTLSTLDKVQIFLDKQQAMPVISFAIFSPIKACLGITQVVYGLAKSLFWGIASSFSSERNLQYKCLRALHEAERGIFYFGFSMINIFTLGVFGYKWERDSEKETREYNAAVTTVNTTLPLLQGILSLGRFL